jgi:hypothetical protein
MHISREKNPFVLQAVAATTLIPFENLINFWKEYLLQLRCFKVEVGLLATNRSIQLIWET